MNEDTLNAFLGEHFDPVFAQVIAASHADLALEVDLEDFNEAARQLIKRVSETSLRSDVGVERKIGLILGAAGLGKTHSIVTTLARLSRQQRVYPVLMQLSAKVDRDNVSLWLLRKLIDELGATHFRDSESRSPLQVMADSMWAKVRESNKIDFVLAVEKEELDKAERRVVDATPKIRRRLELNRTDEPLIAAILLQAADASIDVNSWLHGGSVDKRIGRKYELPRLIEEPERQRIIQGLVRIAAATGAPIIIVLDQIEAVARVADEPLLLAVLTSAIQLVEDSRDGVGLILSALQDTYDDTLKHKLDRAYLDRINSGEPKVELGFPSESVLKRALGLRIEKLFARNRMRPEPNATELIGPSWLLSQAGNAGWRSVFDLICSYRHQCHQERRFITEAEFGSPDSAPVVQPMDDFDKLWEDKLDADLGAVANLTEVDQERLLCWLAEASSLELPEIEAVTTETTQLDDSKATKQVDLRFEAPIDTVVERWKIVFANAPNQNYQLSRQVRSAVDFAHNAKPAILRNKTIPGIDPDGSFNPKSKSQIRDALKDLFDSGGRAVQVTPRDWSRMRVAREFVEERKNAAGFDAWRRETRFLLERAEVGQITRLFELEPQNTPTPTTQETTKEPIDAAPPPTKPEVPPPQMEPSDAADSEPPDCGDPRDRARIALGHDLGDGESSAFWDLDPATTPNLPNYGLLVSGDAGQGKTQVIKALIAEAARLQSPILIFDFKNDYGGEFASDNSLEIIDLSAGLPFNPLKLPPSGASGAQAMPHIYEVSGVLGTTLGLGEQQKSLLRNALESAFQKLGVPLREWVDPNGAAPSLEQVMDIAGEIDDGKQLSVGLLNRLGLLHGMRLLPGDAEARMRFADLVNRRYVLSFHSLPNDDQLKGALAELILIQLQGHMLRGEQPRAFRRLLVFDEAWRAAKSERLIQLAREGRAFGVGVITGSQFADDLAPELTGNLASKLHLFNSDALKRKRIVQATFGATSTPEAKEMMAQLGQLKTFEAALINQQHTPYHMIRCSPYFER